MYDVCAASGLVAAYCFLLADLWTHCVMTVTNRCGTHAGTDLSLLEAILEPRNGGQRPFPVLSVSEGKLDRTWRCSGSLFDLKH